MKRERTAVDTTREWPSWGAIARLAVMLVIATLLQTTVAPFIRILGASPDFALIIIVCVALMKGSEIGAGRYAETADLSAGFAPLLTTFAATLVADILFAMAQFLLERQVPMGFFVARVLIPSLIINTLLAAPLYLAVRLWLRGGGDLHVSRAR